MRRTIIPEGSEGGSSKRKIWLVSGSGTPFVSIHPNDGIKDDVNLIISGLDSLRLVSLTSEARLAAMTCLAIHKLRSQLICAYPYV